MNTYFPFHYRQPNFFPPTIYSLATPLVAEERYLRQTCCLGRFAHLKMKVSPYHHGKTPFLLIWGVSSDEIPKEFAEGIQRGIQEFVEIFSPTPLGGLQFRVFFGRNHPVDSNQTSFRIAAFQALQQAFQVAPVYPIVSQCLSLRG